MSRFIYRTVGVGQISPERLELLSVINVYFNDQAIKFTESIRVNFKSLFIIHLIAVIFLIFIRKYKALIVASFVAFLVSLSWIVFFRQHAAVHTHIDPIIWYLPYFFFAYAIVGLALKEVFLFLKLKFRK